MSRAAPSTRNRSLRYGIGVVLGAAALYACFASIEWTQFVGSFKTARVSWVVAAVLSVLITVGLVTLRWAWLLDAGGTARAFRILWDSVVVGQAVNIVVPLRFGEGARVAFTCRELDLPAGRVMVALALERTFDVAMFGTAVLLLMLTGWLSDTSVGFFRPLAIFALTAIVGLMCIVWLVPACAGLIRRRFGADSRAGRWIDAQSMAVREEWSAVKGRRLLIVTGVLTVLATTAAASTNVLIFHAFNLQLPWLTGLALLVALQFGTSVVSVPGNLGVFHYITVVTLGALNVPRPTALALAVVLHAVSLGPKVALGGLALATTPLRRRTRPSP